MQIPEKKRPHVSKHARGRALIALVVILAIAGSALYWVTRPQAETQVEAPNRSSTLVSRDADQIASITVSAPQGENYTLLYQAGALWYQGENPFPVDDVLAVDLLMACSSLSSEETLAETLPQDLAPFGLDPAQCTVTIAYTQGETATYHIGHPLPLDTGYYFILEGDPRLYRVHDDIWDTFQVAQGVLYPVEQVRLTGSLIDRIALYGQQDQLLYAFEAQNGAFAMTWPHRYPAEETLFANILTALENFRLGAYVGPDTPQARESLGDWQYRLQIHEGSGPAGVVEAGMLTASHREEKTTSLLLWPMGDGQTSYCAYEGSIYRFLRLSLAFVYELDLAWDTLPQQPAAGIALDDLASLEVNGDFYQLIRTERVMANNQLETDAQGQPLWDITVTKNGQAISLDAFSSRLEALSAVSAGGRLPSGYQPTQEATDTLVFTFTNGSTRTLTLAPYDALHHAVGVDGVYLFYIIKGGLSF